MPFNVSIISMCFILLIKCIIKCQISMTSMINLLGLFAFFCVYVDDEGLFSFSHQLLFVIGFVRVRALEHPLFKKVLTMEKVISQIWHSYILCENC